MAKELTKLVDGSKKDVLQAGYVGDPPPMKQEALPEILTPELEKEKRTLQRVVKRLIPTFPQDKLTRQTLEGLWKFFDKPCSEMVQEEMLIRYIDISP